MGNLQPAHVSVDWENIQFPAFNTYEEFEEVIDPMTAVAALYSFLDEKQLQPAITIYGDWQNSELKKTLQSLHRMTRGWKVVKTPNWKNGADERIIDDLWGLAHDPVENFVLVSGDGDYARDVAKICLLRQSLGLATTFYILTFKAKCNRCWGYQVESKNIKIRDFDHFYDQAKEEPSFAFQLVYQKWQATQPPPSRC